MFAGLGWEKEIRSLGDFHVSFTPSLKHDKRAGNQCSDDYELTPFSQSTPPHPYKPLGLLAGPLSHCQETFCHSTKNWGQIDIFP